MTLYCIYQISDLLIAAVTFEVIRIPFPFQYDDFIGRSGKHTDYGKTKPNVINEKPERSGKSQQYTKTLLWGFPSAPITHGYLSKNLRHSTVY